MIVERFALGMAKNLNLSVDFGLGECLNGTFEINGREEKPIIFWLWVDFGFNEEITTS